MFLAVLLFPFLTKEEIDLESYKPPIHDHISTHCDELTNGHLFEYDPKVSGSKQSIEANYYNRCPAVEGDITITIKKPIGQYAFYACERITKVNLAQGASIGIGAFAECTNLESVTFDASLTSIAFDSYSFYSCPQLNIITFPTSYTFGTCCFAKCSSLTATLGANKINKVPNGAFYQTKVTVTKTTIDGKSYIEIPFGSQNLIGESAFEGCSGIDILYVSGSISTSSFENCQLLTTVYWKTSSPIPERAFCGCTSLTTLTFDKDCKISSISQYAFQNANLATINFPETMDTISSNAFENALKTGTALDLNLRDITRVDNSAFEGCTAIKSLTAYKLNNVGDKAFNKCTNLAGELHLSEEMQNIGKYAFASTKLTSITIIFNTAYQHQLEEGAFSSITSLKDVYIENAEFVKNVFLTSTSSGVRITNLNLIGCDVSDDSFSNSIITTLNIEKSNINQNAFRSASITNAIITASTLNEYSFVSSTISTKLTVKSTEDVKEPDSTINGYAFDKANIVSIELTLVAIEDNAFRGMVYRKTPLKLNYYEDGKYSIGVRAFYNTGVSGVNNFGDDIISIGTEAFAYCGNLNSNGLTINAQTIGDGAFRETRYTGKLTIGENVANLVSSTSPVQSQYSIFQGCTFTSIEISDDCTISTIPAYTFENTNIQNTVNLPNTINSIGERAFYKSKVKEVNINGGVTTIPNECFYKCTNLEKVTLPSTVTTISTYAFAGTKLSEIDFPKSLTNINNFAFAKTKLKSISLPYGLTTIGVGAFQECDALAGSLVIPDKVTTLNHHAFYKCAFDKELTLGDSVKDIPSFAFYGCKFNNAKLDLQNVKTIGEYAFYGCTNIKNIDFYYPKDGPGYGGSSSDLSDENKLGSIGNNAFEGCRGINSVLTLGLIKNIGSEAFSRCTALPGVNFGDYVTAIPVKAFYSCTSLNSLSLNHVQTIGDQAFSGCTNLVTVNFGDSLQEIPSKAFYQSSIQGQLSFPQTLKGIGDYAFYQCGGIQGSLNFPQTVGSIGDYAFYECKGLNGNIIFNYDSTATKGPNYNAEIGKYAFYGCTELTGPLNFNSHFKTIREHAFEGLTHLNGSLDLTYVSTIGDYAFAGCTGFTELLKINAPVDNSYITIGRGAFKGCTGFEDGTLSIFIVNDEENSNNRYYEMSYFLRIEDEAFDETDFKTVLYSGRFEPDCTKDSGLKKINKFKAYNYYANKSFCGKTVKRSLSGGAIAGIVIACIVVVAAIVVVIVLFVLKIGCFGGGDKSENEVEMNNNP